MALTDKIQEGVQQWPIALQAEVLDFVAYLLAKARRESSEHEESFWSHVSLTSGDRCSLIQTTRCCWNWQSKPDVETLLLTIHVIFAGQTSLALPLSPRKPFCPP
jgi:hypothetical protein